MTEPTFSSKGPKLVQLWRRFKGGRNWEMETHGKLHGIGIETISGSDLQQDLGLKSLTEYRIGVHLSKQLLGLSLSAKLVMNTASGWRLSFVPVMRV